MKCVYKKILLCLTVAIFGVEIFSQVNGIWDHYTSDDGLSENSVLTMFQDKQGFMWFGSNSGLNRFDGYRFKTYKALTASQNGLLSDRIQSITEDAYGFLWIRTSEGTLYRFDKRNEKFAPMPQSIDMFKGFNRGITGLVNTSLGNLWIVTADAGCFKVEVHPKDFSVTCKLFDRKSKLLPSDTVNSIFEDKNGTYILTQSGFSILKADGSIQQYYHQGAEQLSFFAAKNMHQEIWLCASGGKIVCCRKDGQFVVKQLPTSAGITAIRYLHDKRFLLLTVTDGFFIYNPADQTFNHFNRNNTPELKGAVIQSSYVDKFGEVWLSLDKDGILHFNPNTSTFKWLTMKVDKTGAYLVRSRFIILEDKDSVLWIYPRGGGFSYYDRAAGELRAFHNFPDDPDRWFSNAIYSVYTDVQCNLWMCTFTRGIEKITFYPTTFKLFKPKPGSRGVAENEVRAVCEDRSGVLWVATRTGNLLLFDPNKKLLGPLGAKGRLNEPAKFQELVYTIFQDSKGDVWLGTKGNGAYRLKRKPGRLNFEMEHFINNPKDLYSLSFDAIYSICEDQFGKVWLGSFGGGLNYADESSGRVKFINGFNLLKGYPQKANARIRSIGTIGKILWIGTTNGALLCNDVSVNPGQMHFKSFSRNVSDPLSLSANDVSKVLITSKGQVLLGTMGGGVNVLDETKQKPMFESFNSLNNLSADIVLGMTEDRSGKIWISSENKIIKFDVKTGQSEVFGKNYGIVNTNFSESVSLTLQSGSILFGCNKGIYAFDPSFIPQSTFVPPIVFTGFLLFNKEVRPQEKDSPLKTDINLSKSVTLNANQSVFTIEFSALDYRYPDNILYAYMLESGDKSEYVIQKQRSVTFTKLQPGDYTLKVKSTNSEGIWVKNEREFHLIILPPFWKSGWAYMIYAVLLLLLILLASFILFTIFKLKNKVKMEKEMTNSKLQFFTEISHELRTPLTLIALPVEKLLKDGALTKPVSIQLLLVKRNIDRMVGLLNQILDFRKVQETGVQLNITEVNLSELTADVCGYYADIAVQRSLQIEITDDLGGATVFADKDKVEKIIYNLLSNAFKYAPEKSTVRISTYQENSRLFVAVKDEGKGISPKIKGNLFKLYESTGNDNPLQSGTGIGLAFAKKIAEAHKAVIEVESSSGAGTCIKVGFLPGKDHFGKKVLQSFTDVSEVIPLTEVRHEINTDITLLVVEDNVELRSFLVNSLSEKYHVVEASDGREGADKASAIVPDLIISDIMMPGLDGIELTKQLKNNLTTSHIPVILLTAKTAMDDKLTGLEQGADDYITKPFSAAYLEARVENMLTQRKRLQAFYRSSFAKWEIIPDQPEYVSSDKQFMDRLMAYMEANYTNPNLAISDIELFVCLSTSSLYRKLKSLTDLSPNEFIREFRIKKAAHLILKTNHTISQISEMAGFNDYRYFTRCFKHCFNQTPSQYRDEIIKE